MATWSEYRAVFPGGMSTIAAEVETYFAGVYTTYADFYAATHTKYIDDLSSVTASDPLVTEFADWLISKASAVGAGTWADFENSFVQLNQPLANTVGSYHNGQSETPADLAAKSTTDVANHIINDYTDIIADFSEVLHGLKYWVVYAEAFATDAVAYLREIREYTGYDWAEYERLFLTNRRYLFTENELETEWSPNVLNGLAATETFVLGIVSWLKTIASAVINDSDQENSWQNFRNQFSTLQRPAVDIVVQYYESQSDSLEDFDGKTNTAIAQELAANFSESNIWLSFWYAEANALAARYFTVFHEYAPFLTSIPLHNAIAFKGLMGDLGLKDGFLKRYSGIDLRGFANLKRRQLAGDLFSIDDSAGADRYLGLFRTAALAENCALLLAENYSEEEFRQQLLNRFHPEMQELMGREIDALETASTINSLIDLGDTSWSDLLDDTSGTSTRDAIQNQFNSHNRADRYYHDQARAWLAVADSASQRQLQQEAAEQEAAAGPEPVSFSVQLQFYY